MNFIRREDPIWGDWDLTSSPLILIVSISEEKTRFEGIETQPASQNTGLRARSEEKTRFEGIETTGATKIVGGHAQSEEKTRFEGIETLLSHLEL